MKYETHREYNPDAPANILPGINAPLLPRAKSR